MHHWHVTPPPSWRFWQEITNGQPVPEQSLVTTPETPIPVTARIVWAVDGEERLDGWAIRWTRDQVLVELRDQRCATVGAWLAPADLKRR
ncbi:MAG: hypothetical protein H0V38_07325 [Sporichthyaceae bacterium]|nr:hypothetical protein [Sporichthyaceae bacterium]